MTKKPSGDIINLELNKISNWLKLNRLSLNITKTKCMIFHSVQKQVQCPKLEIDSIKIEQVQKFNCLGIILDENLSWKGHIEYISSKISRTNGILNRLKRVVPMQVKLALYNS